MRIMSTLFHYMFLFTKPPSQLAFKLFSTKTHLFNLSFFQHFGICFLFPHYTLACLKMAIYSGSPHQTLEDFQKAPPAPRVLCAFLRPTRFRRVWPTGIFWVKQPLPPVSKRRRRTLDCPLLVAPFLLASDDQSFTNCRCCLFFGVGKVNLIITSWLSWCSGLELVEFW